MAASSTTTWARSAFGLSVLLRDGDQVFRTYFTTARGVDRLRTDFNLLDLTPSGGRNVGGLARRLAAGPDHVLDSPARRVLTLAAARPALVNLG